MMRLKSVKKIPVVLFFSMITTACRSQSITGGWTGKAYLVQGNGFKYDSVNMRLSIVKNSDGTLKVSTYSLVIENEDSSTVTCSGTGKLNKDQSIYIKETAIADAVGRKNFCFQEFKFKLLNLGDRLQLTGTWQVVKKSNHCYGSGTAYFEKQ